MTDQQDRSRRKRRHGNNVLSLYLVQCLDGTRPANQMPFTDQTDESDLIPHFAKIKKHSDDGSKSKFTYGSPAHSAIVRSQGSYLYDRQGNSYLDSVSGVSHVGHCHPRVTQTAQLQLACFGTGMPINQPLDPKDRSKPTKYSERLLKTLPRQLDKVLFFTSGSEANDAAIQMARSFTGNYDVVVFEEGFHGSLGIVSDVSHKIISRGGIPKKSWVHILPIPDTTRGPYSDADPNAYDKYFEDARKVLDDAINSGRKIACLLTEPIFTFHSVLIPPARYFQNICNYIRKIGGLVIIDEVQTGLGRLGDYTWGFEIHGIIPDIMTTGKPLGNGHPLAVTVSSEKLADSLGIVKDLHEPTMTQEAIGNTVLDVMNNEELQANACHVGNVLIGELKRLMFRHPFIGGVHGVGLLVGIEFVWDRDEMTPAREIAQVVLYQMREHRVITAVEGKFQNIMFLIPPMCFSEEDAKKFMTALGSVLDEIESLDHDEIIEKLGQASERYSSWNNIPEDYLSSCSTRSDRGPTFDQTNPRTEIFLDDVVETSDEDDDEANAGSDQDDVEKNNYDELD